MADTNSTPAVLEIGSIILDAQKKNDELNKRLGDMSESVKTEEEKLDSLKTMVAEERDVLKNVQVELKIAKDSIKSAKNAYDDLLSTAQSDAEKVLQDAKLAIAAKEKGLDDRAKDLDAISAEAKKNLEEAQAKDDLLKEKMDKVIDAKLKLVNDQKYLSDGKAQVADKEKALTTREQNVANSENALAPRENVVKEKEVSLRAKTMELTEREVKVSVSERSAVDLKKRIDREWGRLQTYVVLITEMANKVTGVAPNKKEEVDAVVDSYLKTLASLYSDPVKVEEVKVEEVKVEEVAPKVTKRKKTS